MIMKKFLLSSVLFAVVSIAYGKGLPIPNCPYDGNAICTYDEKAKAQSNNFQDKKDKLKDALCRCSVAYTGQMGDSEIKDADGKAVQCPDKAGSNLTWNNLQHNLNRAIDACKTAQDAKGNSEGGKNSKTYCNGAYKALSYQSFADAQKAAGSAGSMEYALPNALMLCNKSSR